MAFKNESSETYLNSTLNSNNFHIIAINCGYGKTKVKYKDDEFVFSSKISPYIDEDLSKTILVDGERYVVGQGKYDLNLDKTSTLHQKILINYAFSKIPYEYKNVIAAMPSNSYINKNARQDYKDFIHSFYGVHDVIIYPEGASLSILDYSYFKNKLVLLMDIGHYTINFLLFDDCNLIKDKVFSRDLGCDVLMNRIRKTLEQHSLSNIPDYQLKYHLDNSLVKNVILEYIEEIKLELARMQYPTNFHNIRCTGGGSLFLKDYLMSEFNALVKDNAVYENVEGLYLIAKEVWKYE